MAKKYHIGKNGPAVCKARFRPCPLGGEENHYSSLSEAEEVYSKKMEEEYSFLPAEQGNTGVRAPLDDEVRELIEKEFEDDDITLISEVMGIPKDTEAVADYILEADPNAFDKKQTPDGEVIKDDLGVRGPARRYFGDKGVEMLKERAVQIADLNGLTGEKRDIYLKTVYDNIDENVYDEYSLNDYIEEQLKDKDSYLSMYKHQIENK